METWTRRELLAASALGAAGLAGRRGLAGVQADDKEKPKGPAPASESIVLGFIGVGGMGSGLLNTFKGFPDVRVAAVCDVYEPHARRAQSAADGQARGLSRLPQGARSQGHRCRRDRHARPLARDSDDPGLPGGQGRLLREAAHAPDRRGPGRRDRGREGQARHPDGQPDPRGRELSSRGRDRPLREFWARSARRGSGWPPTAAAWASPPTATRRRLRLRFLARPCPCSVPFNPNRFTFNWRWFWDYGGGSC